MVRGGIHLQDQKMTGWYPEVGLETKGQLRCSLGVHGGGDSAQPRWPQFLRPERASVPAQGRGPLQAGRDTGDTGRSAHRCGICTRILTFPLTTWSWSGETVWGLK